MNCIKFKRNAYRTLAIAYLLIVVIHAAFSVGDIPQRQAEPFPWYLPVLVFIFLGTPMIASYYAGLATEDTG